MRRGGAVRCIVSLISQGINAQQTVANAVGGTQLQEYINLESVQTLRQYHTAYHDLRHASAGGERRCRFELQQLEALMTRYEQTVLTSHAEKNTEILLLSEQLTRWMGGARITSCKSAKDRTSMAVTAEQAQLLVERHRLGKAEAAALADEMRIHGVRWQNMRKNVSGGQYAFNWLQQRLLPEIYRAPKGTYRPFGGTAT